jgi:hypothetical protein
MKRRTDRHVQLNLRLADPKPAVFPADKHEELSRAIIDLLLEAIASDSAAKQAPDGSDHEQ